MNTRSENQSLLERMRAFEDAYWTLVQDMSPESWLNPVNLAEEERRFFAAVDAGNAYSPVFAYRPIAASCAENLKRLHGESMALPEPFAAWYGRLIDENRQVLDAAVHRDAPASVTTLRSRYGAPDAALLDEAMRIVKTAPEENPEEETVEAREAALFFARELAAFGLAGWTAVTERIPATVHVRSRAKAIYVREDARFAPDALVRLREHEIGAHVLRSENGWQTGLRIMAIGLPGYLEAEEGLAVTAEERTGLLRGRDLRSYAFRVIACSATMSAGFSDVHRALTDLGCPPRKAFAITARVKLGLERTSLAGGWTKDQVYLSGYRAVRRLDDRTLKALYRGKFGIADIPAVEAVAAMTGGFLRLPAWLGG